MNNGRLEFDYTELKQYLNKMRPLYSEGTYEYCQLQVEQFFLDKLTLKVVK